MATEWVVRDMSGTFDSDHIADAPTRRKSANIGSSRLFDPLSGLGQFT
jgi:hypothetical protein